MNKRNILKVAKAIETAAKTREGLRGELGFNMASFASYSEADLVDSCGTTACIAGWAVALKNPDMTAGALVRLVDDDGLTITDLPKSAAEYLGLTMKQAHRLFRSDASARSLSIIEPLHAVAVLRHLAKTGKVDWSVKP